MHSTSGADAEYKLRQSTTSAEISTPPAEIFRHAAAVRAARVRAHRFGIYTYIFNAHVFP
jgi:hypothetical protein